MKAHALLICPFALAFAAPASAHRLDEYLQAGRFFETAVEQLKQTSGVSSAAAAMGVPTGQYGSNGGYVIDGQLHPHIALANDKPSFGGPLEVGTQVFTFAAVTLGVLADGADLKGLDDKTYR